VTRLYASISLRVHTVPTGQRYSKGSLPSAGWRSGSVGHRLLSVVMDDEERGARTFHTGTFEVTAREPDGMYGMAEPLTLTEPLIGLIMGEVVPGGEAATIRAWADEHDMEVLTPQAFIHDVLLPEVYGVGTLGAAWDWGVLLGSLATAWAPSARSSKSWTLTLCPLHNRRRTKRFHNRSAHPCCPQIRVRALTEPYVQAIEFTKPRSDGQWGVPHFRGRFLNVREKAYVITGEDHSLRSACRALGVAPPIEPTPVTAPGRIDPIFRRLGALQSLAAAVQEELLRHTEVVSADNGMRR
jgi:hypothetical protein